jgi:hypothetical protein
MKQRITANAKSIYDFEIPENQAKALSVIPVEILQQKAFGTH